MAKKAKSTAKKTKAAAPKKAKETRKKAASNPRKTAAKATVRGKTEGRRATPAAAPKAPKVVEVQAPVVAMNDEIREGVIAPDFALSDAHGKTHKLSNYRGRKVVLYFYPKDNTPGCTIEACDFRDKNSAINAAGATTFGISPDNHVSHQKFITKYNLGFTLLCDLDREVAKKFGVWKEKNNYGQTYWGIERTTFLIDEEGRIAKIFPKVQVQGHVEQVLATIKGSSSTSKAGASRIPSSP